MRGSSPIEAERDKDAALAAKDAEIARLRAELDAAKASNNAEVAENTRLRSDLSAARAELFAARNDILREGLARIEAETQLAAARATLATEREACDSTIGVLRSYLSCDPVARALTETERAAVKRSLFDYNARRAAEAKGAEHG